ncbi:MAG: plastocyanin/azurin family copper-binding protein [Candidatus Rokubacteria bacterium]|nr:plastocyanin/azurin family copper-binding protein [Candidatus Rokubacteria bacterium]
MLRAYMEPGQRVRWMVHDNVHTTTVYHPRNARHSLRIPEGAEPWDSRYLVRPGNYFEVTLTAEGVYDYFCMPHEIAGMVGRIVVGRPGGPGALPFDYFKGKPGTADWQPVPAAAQRVFPSVSAIMRHRVVRKGDQGGSRRAPM